MGVRITGKIRRASIALNGKKRSPLKIAEGVRQQGRRFAVAVVLPQPLCCVAAGGTLKHGSNRRVTRRNLQRRVFHVPG